MNPILLTVAVSLAALGMYAHLYTDRGARGVRTWLLEEEGPNVTDREVAEVLWNSRAGCLFIAAYCALMAWGVTYYSA